MSNDARKVITSNIRPPVPSRQFDWTATFDSYEPGDVIGYGSTEAEAVADLRGEVANVCPECGGSDAQECAETCRARML